MTSDHGAPGIQDIFERKVAGRTYAAPQYGWEITLTVGPDVPGEAVAAMSRAAMAALGVSEGETVELIGAWTRTARVACLDDSETVTAVRLDAETRLALPVSLGQEVGVRKECRHQ